MLRLVDRDLSQMSVTKLPLLFIGNVFIWLYDEAVRNEWFSNLGQLL